MAIEEMHKNKYKTVIFDLDGTLIDSSKGIIAAICEVLNKYNLSLANANDYYQFIGPPLISQILRVFDISITQAEIINAEIINMYETKYIPDFVVYDGIVPMLKNIYNNNIELMLATYKPQKQTQSIIQMMGVDYIFSYLSCGLENSTYSKAVLVADALNHSNSKIFESVYVGDTRGDEKAASDNNIDFIGVQYSFSNVTFSSSTKVAPTVAALKEALIV